MKNIINYIKAVLVILFLLLCGDIKPQSFSPGGLFYEKSSTTKGNTGNLLGTVHHYGAFIKLPVYYEKDKYALTGEMNFTGSNYNYNSISMSFNTLGATGVWYSQITSGWDYFIFLQNKLAAPKGKPIFKNTYTFNGGAGAGYAFNENLYAAAGIYYIHSFGNPIALPLVVLNYNSKSFFVATTFPDFVSVGYRITSQVKAAISTKFTSRQFLLEEAIGSSKYFRESTATLGAEVEVKPVKNIGLTIFAGSQIKNKYQFFDKSKIYSTNNYKNRFTFLVNLNYIIDNED